MELKKHHPILIAVFSFLILAWTPAQSETIEIVGTGDGMAVLMALAKAFKQTHPQHAVNVPESIGSSGGIKAVGNDKSQIGRVARKIKDKEKPYGLVYLPIAKIPTVFFVNKSVGISNLSVQQVNDIYSGKTTDWNAVGGTTGKIRVVRREDGDSSLGNLKATLPGFKDVVITTLSKTTTLTNENLSFVAEQTGAIGFGPYSDAIEEDVEVLMLGGNKPTDKDYPSFGVLALILKEVNRKGAIAELIDFVTTPDATKAMESAHAVPYK